jgi:hypothetical protein
MHFIIEMIRWTGLAPWKFEFSFPGSLAFTFLEGGESELITRPKCPRTETPLPF